MKQKYKYYNDLYDYDAVDKAYQIKVSLDDYEDIYDDWDPSPFKKRDIEAEFSDFVIDSSSDIPLKFGLVIVLYLPEIEKAVFKEKALLEAYTNHFLFMIGRVNKRQGNIRNKIISNLFLSISFLFFGTFYTYPGHNVLLAILQEGIFIGGWVFLWEVFTLVFITLRDLKKRRKELTRLLNAEIRFVYN